MLGESIRILSRHAESTPWAKAAMLVTRGYAGVPDVLDENGIPIMVSELPIEGMEVAVLYRWRDPVSRFLKADVDRGMALIYDPNKYELVTFEAEGDNEKVIAQAATNMRNIFKKQGYLTVRVLPRDYEENLSRVFALKPIR